MSWWVIDVKGAGAVAGGGSLACAEPREHLREIFRADIEVFADSSPQHRCRNVPVAALRLDFPKTVQDHSLLPEVPAV
jgi:hypothetical protein